MLLHEDTVIDKLDEIICDGEKLNQRFKKPSIEDKTKATRIIVEYIKKNGLIVYGGMTIDKHLKKAGHEGIYINQSEWDQDYDCYSSDFVKDSVNICNLLHDAGFDKVNRISALSSGTFRIRFDFHFIIDLTYVPKESYEKLTTITVDGIRYIDIQFQKVDIYKGLTYAEFNVFRWEKDFKRLCLIEKYYPVKVIAHDNTLPEGFSELIAAILNVEGLIISGVHAAEYYTKTGLNLSLQPVKGYVLDFNVFDSVRKQYDLQLRRFMPYLKIYDESIDLYKNSTLVASIYRISCFECISTRDDSKYTDYFNTLGFLYRQYVIGNNYTTQIKQLVDAIDISKVFTVKCIKGQQVKPKFITPYKSYYPGVERIDLANYKYALPMGITGEELMPDGSLISQNKMSLSTTLDGGSTMSIAEIINTKIAESRRFRYKKLEQVYERIYNFVKNNGDAIIVDEYAYYYNAIKHDKAYPIAPYVSIFVSKSETIFALSKNLNAYTYKKYSYSAIQVNQIEVARVTISNERTVKLYKISSDNKITAGSVVSTFIIYKQLADPREKISTWKQLVEHLKHVHLDMFDLPKLDTTPRLLNQGLFNQLHTKQGNNLIYIGDIAYSLMTGSNDFGVIQFVYTKDNLSKYDFNDYRKFHGVDRYKYRNFIFDMIGGRWDFYNQKEELIMSVYNASDNCLAFNMTKLNGTSIAIANPHLLIATMLMDYIELSHDDKMDQARQILAKINHLAEHRAKYLEDNALSGLEEGIYKIFHIVCKGINTDKQRRANEREHEMKLEKIRRNVN